MTITNESDREIRIKWDINKEPLTPDELKRINTLFNLDIISMLPFEYPYRASNQRVELYDPQYLHKENFINLISSTLRKTTKKFFIKSEVYFIDEFTFLPGVKLSIFELGDDGDVTIGNEDDIYKLVGDLIETDIDYSALRIDALITNGINPMSLYQLNGLIWGTKDEVGELDIPHFENAMFKDDVDFKVILLN